MAGSTADVFVHIVTPSLSHSDVNVTSPTDLSLARRMLPQTTASFTVAL